MDPAVLDNARVIHIGERHDADNHHRFQFALLESLRERGQPLAVGLEMVDLTQQAVLDDYLAGRTDWREFSRSVGFSGWESLSPWYRRILEWCRRNAVPVYALNAPRSVTRKLAAGKPLTADEKRLLPNFPEPPGGFAAFQKLLPPHGSTASLRRYYAAQRAWDQVMAFRALEFLDRSDATLVVLLGAAHADPRYGVPWYVRRKSSASQLILLPR